MRLHTLQTKFLMVLVLAPLILPVRVGACGFRSDKPHAHFDGADEQGHVLYAETLGNLDLGDDVKLPIYAVFQSNWQSSSPYLGQGWMMPLLESKIIQIDDNTFQLWTPDGWYQFMGRDTTTPTILNGQGGWKAVISGDNTVTAWAPCGWKLTYSSGKITSIVTPKNQDLEMVYRDGKIVEIDVNGAPILQVVTDSSTGIVRALQFNKGTVALEQADKPLVEIIKGQNVVGSVAKSLSKVTFSDGKVDPFRFTVDDKVQPRIDIGVPGSSDFRSLSWNPATSFITQDNNWTYQITPSPSGQTSAFSRKSAKDGSEAWFNDPTTGTETTETNGVKRVASSFTSGKLAGYPRKTVESVNGVEKIISASDYDEQGRPIRILDKGKTRSIVYDDINHSETVYSESKLEMTTYFDEQNRLRSAVAPDGFKRTIEYLPDGSAKETDTFPDGSVVSQ